RNYEETFCDCEQVSRVMVVRQKDLWSLVWGNPQVDPGDLAGAIHAQVGREPLDYRTRLLIRDSVEALKKYWGAQRLEAWLAQCPWRGKIEAICQESFDEPGFPSLSRRLMEKTNPEDVRQFLRELGTRLHRPVRLCVGGSVALILPEYISRSTEDIDVVDELPAEIRAQQRFLDQLTERFGLHLGHFQSHYLPKGWEERLHYLDAFGQLQVYLVDVHDVFLSKLFSVRTKDRDDLRMLAPQLSKETLIRRLKETTASFMSEASLRQRAADNWYIVYGEPLPS